MGSTPRQKKLDNCQMTNRNCRQIADQRFFILFPATLLFSIWPQKENKIPCSILAENLRQRPFQRV